MSVFVLDKDNNRKDEVLSLTEICKSSSMIMGGELRKAHYQLGEIISTQIMSASNSNSYAVLILMRAGLCYGSGIADKLEELGASVTIIFINDDTISSEDLDMLSDKEIIIVDAVINSGKSVFTLLNQLPENGNNSVKLATTVIPNSSVGLFDGLKLFTVRTSENQYKGAKVNKISDGKGPDTGDRLFNTY